jgi:hypothetical protein
VLVLCYWQSRDKNCRHCPVACAANGRRGRAVPKASPRARKCNPPWDFSHRRSISKMTAVKQPNSSTPFIALSGQSSHQRARSLGEISADALQNLHVVASRWPSASSAT